MAYSRVPFTYTGGPQVFPTNFALGVLETDHIRVTVDGVVDGLGDPVEYAFTYNIANGDVTVLDTLTSGQTGVIQRSIPLDELVADFEAGDDVSKRNLVRATKQTLMAVQEAADGREADSLLLQDTVDDINALVVSIADDVAAVDAAVLAAASSATSASGSAATATTQAGIATTQAGLADTARVAAEAALSSAGIPSIVGNALRFLRVNAGATAYELITAATALIALGAQAANTLLTAIAGISSNGLIVRTGAGAAVSRSVSGTTNQITVTDGDGVSGNPTIAAVVASQAEAQEGTDNTKLMTPLRVRQAIGTRFESAQITFALDGSGSVAHGLGAQPKEYGVYLVCTTANSGWSIGDEIKVPTGSQIGGSHMGVTLGCDATNMYWAVGSNVQIRNKNTTVTFTNITAASWRLVIRAKL